ncbi:hypothetical protein BKA93DRAFT_931741 [Sparassis latifolia]
MTPMASRLVRKNIPKKKHVISAGKRTEDIFSARALNKGSKPTRKVRRINSPIEEDDDTNDDDTNDDNADDDNGEAEEERSEHGSDDSNGDMHDEDLDTCQRRLRDVCQWFKKSRKNGNNRPTPKNVEHYYKAARFIPRAIGPFANLIQVFQIGMRGDQGLLDAEDELISDLPPESVDEALQCYDTLLKLMPDLKDQLMSFKHDASTLESFCRYLKEAARSSRGVDISNIRHKALRYVTPVPAQAGCDPIPRLEELDHPHHCKKTTPGPASGRKSIADIYGMTKITPHNIAYICVLVRFALNLQMHWSERDSKFDTVEFFQNIVGLFDKPKDSRKWSDSTLKWWNDQVLRADTNENECANRRNGCNGLATLKEQCAARYRQAASHLSSPYVEGVQISNPASTERSGKGP